MPAGAAALAEPCDRCPDCGNAHIEARCDYGQVRVDTGESLARGVVIERVMWYTTREPVAAVEAANHRANCNPSGESA